MIIKEREKPLALKVLESLNARTQLSDLERKEYVNQSKGYPGELLFDPHLRDLPFENLVINDLRLRDNGQMIQIDSLLLASNRLYLYEVKNYSGSYDYKDGALHGRSDFIITNPLTQVHRSLPVLHNLIRKLGYPMYIQPYVVFINPNFYLYQLPRDKPFLFANQLTQHFDQLARKQRSLNADASQLADQLIGLHDKDYRPPNLPHYDFSLLKKGILCPLCFSFERIHTRQNRICAACGYRETAAEAIKRSAEECHLLYPELSITKRLIYEWCGAEYDEQRIQRVLARHFLTTGQLKSTIYELSPSLLNK